MTKTELANILNIDSSMIEQVDAKQLFIVRRSLNKELYSYRTKVGYSELVDGVVVWKLTTTKYSPTTSKQLSQFSNMMRSRGINCIYSDEV
jgi:hypothetical protein